jgi:hypothetical protein
MEFSPLLAKRRRLTRIKTKNQTKRKMEAMKTRNFQAPAF